MFLVQVSLIIIYVYIGNFSSVYYTLLYVFILFFLFGISLSLYQLDLFTAFLWLIECSVIFVFLLLLFYLNVKNIVVKISFLFYIYFFLFFCCLCLIFVTPNTNLCLNDLTVYFLIDNSYEGVFNLLQNDLFVFFISYYVLNNMELLF